MAEETSDRLNLTGDLAIRQGKPYSFTILFPGDFSDHTIRSEIRDKFGGSLLASFSFGTTTYDAESGISTIRPSLSAIVTAALPRTRGGQTHVFDIEATLIGDVVEILPPGDIQVLGEVTLDAES